MILDGISAAQMMAMMSPNVGAATLYVPPAPQATLTIAVIPPPPPAPPAPAPVNTTPSVGTPQIEVSMLGPPTQIPEEESTTPWAAIGVGALMLGVALAMRGRK